MGSEKYFVTKIWLFNRLFKIAHLTGKRKPIESYNSIGFYTKTVDQELRSTRERNSGAY